MKVECPVCKRMVALKRDGTFHAHGFIRDDPASRWCEGSWTSPTEGILMPANYMPKETRGRPKDGIRRNGKDPWKEELINLMQTGVIKELNRKDIEYGHSQDHRSVQYFTFMDEDARMRTLCVKITETY